MLTVLETLGPAERAVFVFTRCSTHPTTRSRKVLGKTPAAVRQIAHRARERVAAGRPRMQADRAQQQAAVEKFIAAMATGDVGGLVEVLAPEVVLLADGGGVVAAAREPITGAENVVAFLARGGEGPRLQATTAWLNGALGVRVRVGGATAAVSLVVEDGRVTRLDAISNPEKLRWLEKVAELRR